MRFSIIVPVYNVEKYIRRCMESLVDQSFSDYEIIAVDDESPDGSMDIVAEYAEAYPGRITMLHQKNTRQGGARNNGVRHAKGDYLVFVDSDDYVNTDMLERVEEVLQRDPCDILVFAHAPVSESGEALGSPAMPELAPGRYIPRESPRVVMLPGQPWGKAFRREFYLNTGFQFPEKLLYEDIFTRVLYARADSLVICREVLYYYVQSGNSTIRQKLTPRMLDVLEVADRTERALSDCDPVFRQPGEVALIYCILYILDSINLRDPTNPMQEKMADYIKDHYPGYRENPYASPALVKNLDCLTARDFKRYHRLQWANRQKDRLLEIPLFQRLNTWRKSRS